MSMQSRDSLPNTQARTSRFRAFRVYRFLSDAFGVSDTLLETLWVAVSPRLDGVRVIINTLSATIR